MCGAAAALTRAAPATLTSQTRDASASSKSSSGVNRTIPAQLTTARISPSAAPAAT